MLRLANDLWIDQAGFIVSAEMVLISTVGAVGIGTGLVCLRDAVNRELTDVACALTALDQSYCYTGFRSYQDPCRLRIKAQTAGSSFPAIREVCVEEADCDPVVEGVLQPIPEHDPVPQFRDGMLEERHQEERHIEERVIRKPRRHVEDCDPADDEIPALRLPQTHPELPCPAPAIELAPLLIRDE